MLIDDDAFDRAVAHFGSVNAMAKGLGMTRQAIFNWRRVPSPRAVQIEQATNGAVTRHDLRPDVFGPAQDAAA